MIVSNLTAVESFNRSLLSIGSYSLSNLVGDYVVPLIVLSVIVFSILYIISLYVQNFQALNNFKGIESFIEKEVFIPVNNYRIFPIDERKLSAVKGYEIF